VQRGEVGPARPVARRVRHAVTEQVAQRQRYDGSGEEPDRTSDMQVVEGDLVAVEDEQLPVGERLQVSAHLAEGTAAQLAPVPGDRRHRDLGVGRVDRQAGVGELQAGIQHGGGGLQRLESVRIRVIEESAGAPVEFGGHLRPRLSLDFSFILAISA